MFNPAEMFQGPGGAGMQAMAQQFGLTVEQTQRALEALMPALTLGLQRGATDPTGFARLFGMTDPGRPAPGGDVFGQMFGSVQLMQAVLQQASATSGVGSQVLRQMLPMMAGAVVASIVHVMLNPPPTEPARKAAAPPPTVQFPFGPVWTEMARAFLVVAEPQPAKPPSKPQAGAAPDTAANAGPDMFQQMVRTGAEVQGQNIKAMQELFEVFWPATPRAGAVPPTDAAQDQAPHASGQPSARPRRKRPDEGGAR